MKKTFSQVEPIGSLIKLPAAETETSEIEQSFNVQVYSTSLCSERMETPRKNLKRSRLRKDDLHTESDQADSSAEDSITRHETKSPTANGWPGGETENRLLLQVCPKPLRTAVLESQM